MSSTPLNANPLHQDPDAASTADEGTQSDTQVRGHITSWCTTSDASAPRVMTPLIACLLVARLAAGVLEGHKNSGGMLGMFTSCDGNAHSARIGGVVLAE